MSRFLLALTFVCIVVLNASAQSYRILEYCATMPFSCNSNTPADAFEARPDAHPSFDDVIGRSYKPTTYFFVTNRRLDEMQTTIRLVHSPKAFLDEPGSGIFYGRVFATVPSKRARGEQNFSTEPAEVDPDLQFGIQLIYLLSTIDDLATNIDASTSENAESEARSRNRREILLYVHGVNNDFADGGYSAVQLAQDVNFEGTALVFSWPSLKWEGNPFNVTWIKSVNHAAQSAADLRHLIEAIPLGRAWKVHAVAHSLGTRPAVGAVAAPSHAESRLTSLTLVAPEIPTAIFDDWASTLSERTSVTIYCSRTDEAIAKAVRSDGLARVGQCKPRKSLEAVDVVEVVDSNPSSTTGRSSRSSGRSRSPPDHTVFFASEIVLDDFRDLLAGVPASRRFASRGRWHTLDIHPASAAR